MLIRNSLICITSGYSPEKLRELCSNPTTSPLTYTKIKYTNSIDGIFYESRGTGKYTRSVIYKFLETNYNLKILDLNLLQEHILYYYYLFIFPKGFSWDKQILFTLSTWYHLFSYKGWRYLFDLPVNGQRTWSNNKTKYRMRNKLYEYQLKCFRKKYGIHTKTNLRMSFMSEHINLMWKLEWLDEWLSAYSIFNSTKQKTKFFRLKINYRHLLNFQITTPKSIEHKKKKKNRKKIKSEFTVGFDTLYVVSLFSKKKHLFKHLK